MTDIKPFEYEDWSGDKFTLNRNRDGFVLLDAISTRGSEIGVDIAVADVRKVTSAMHEQAGLPDRWALLRDWLDRRVTITDTMARTHGDAEARKMAAERSSAYRAVVVRMTEIGAGR